jgi:hypothetical protein
MATFDVARAGASAPAGTNAGPPELRSAEGRPVTLVNRELLSMRMLADSEVANEHPGKICRTWLTPT